MRIYNNLNSPTNKEENKTRQSDIANPRPFEGVILPDIIVLTFIHSQADDIIILTQIPIPEIDLIKSI